MSATATTGTVMATAMRLTLEPGAAASTLLELEAPAGVFTSTAVPVLTGTTVSVMSEVTGVGSSVATAGASEGVVMDEAMASRRDVEDCRDEDGGVGKETKITPG